MSKTPIIKAQPQLKSIFSDLDTTKLTPFTVDDGLDPETQQPQSHIEYKNAQGDVVKKNVSVENTSGENNDPNANVYHTAYKSPVTIGGQTYRGTYGEDGSFQYGEGKEFYQNKHHWIPVIDGQGKITYTNNDRQDGFGDFVKMVAPLVLNAAFPGAGTFLGKTLLGAGAAGASTLGGALIGGGTSALAGGDPLRGAIMGGLMPNLGGQIGDTGISVGQAVKGVQAIQNKNPLALASLALNSFSPNQSFGPNSSDIEPGSFPSSGGEQYPQPFTVASANDQASVDSTASPLNNILPNAQKIIGGLGAAQKLINTVKSGPLGVASALIQAAKSSAPQASGDKLSPARADVRTLFPVSNSAPAYVEPSKLIPLSDFDSLSKLLTG